MLTNIYFEFLKFGLIFHEYIFFNFGPITNQIDFFIMIMYDFQFFSFFNFYLSSIKYQFKLLINIRII